MLRRTLSDLHPEVAVRPAVHPALPRLRRGPGAVQIGLGPGQALVLDGLDPALADLLVELDGSRVTTELRRVAQRRGIDPAALDDALLTLGRAGLLVDAGRSTTTGDIAGARVEVHGADRVGAAVAILLASAGVGHVLVHDRRVTEPHDPCPGGLAPADVGRPRGRAAELAAGAAVPGGTSRRGALPGEVDVAVLAPGAGSLRHLADRMLGRGVAHLAVRLGADAGTVGPLVLPGRSSCLRCHDLHRGDRDRAWPELAGQAEKAGSAPPAPVPLAWSLAATAAQQVLSHLRGTTPCTVDGTVDVALPDLLARRRSWRPHPGCGCAWAG